MIVQKYQNIQCVNKWFRIHYITFQGVVLQQKKKTNGFTHPCTHMIFICFLFFFSFHFVSFRIFSSRFFFFVFRLVLREFIFLLISRDFLSWTTSPFPMILYLYKWISASTDHVVYVYIYIKKKNYICIQTYIYVYIYIYGRIGQIIKC